MSRDAELTLLIQSARGAEEPHPQVRAEVRRRLEQQLQSGAVDLELERAVLPEAGLPRAARRLPRAVTWGVPLAAIGAAALIALRLAPLSGDPLVLAPPPQPMIATPPEPTQWEPDAPAGSSLAEGHVSFAAPTPPVAAAPAPATREAPARLDEAARAERAPFRRKLAQDELKRTALPRPPSLLEESRALEQVQRALSEKKYWKALELIREQDRQFARGQLGQERAVAKALAACNTGNAVVRSEVRALARDASGLYADRLRSACPEAFAAEPAAGAGSVR